MTVGPAERKQMLKRVLAFGLTAGLAAAVLGGCGNSGTTKPVPGNGTLFTFVGDTPACDILTFRTTLTGLTLTGGSSTATVLNSASAAVKVNFAALRDFSTVLNFTNVPEGTYDKATVTFSAPQMNVYSPLANPPFAAITVNLSNTKPSFSISPPLTVTKGETIGLRMDFDVLHSIQFDASGQVAPDVTPVMTLTPVNASSDQGFGEMDDVLGFVQRVDTFSANPSFIGDFAMQLLSGTGPSIVVSLMAPPSPTRNCQLEGCTTVCVGPPSASGEPCAQLQKLSQLLTGSFVEVDGYVDAKANFVANSVEVEDQEDVANKKIALLGYVTSVTRDTSGNLTQFNLYVREEEPDDEFDVSLDSIVAVNVSSSTIYQFASRSTNFANLPFDSTSVQVGQELIVHGVVTKAPAPAAGQPALPATDAADKVYLKLQTHPGNFASLVQAGSDDKTGAFTFSPCASFFQDRAMMVFTSGQTAFVNVGGLNELTPQPSLLLKGLLFFESQGTTINGVTVPAGTFVLLAKQVHQTI